MTEANKNLVIRIASAAVLLPAVVALLWVGPRSTACLIAFASGVLAFELYSMAFKKLDPAQVLGILASAAIPFALGFWPKSFPLWLVAGSAGLVMLLLGYYLFAGPLSDAPARASLIFTGVIYCGLLLGTLAGLRRAVDGLSWIFLALAVTWVNDTGAYAAGRAFGKHKLYPKVSPGKTWEGFAGGVVSSLVGALVCKATFFPALTLPDCLAIALPCSLLGPGGDLCESMLKRAWGAKDSGKFMPGHGGLLDRVDALMFNAPYIYLYVLLTRT